MRALPRVLHFSIPPPLFLSTPEVSAGDATFPTWTNYQTVAAGITIVKLAHRQNTGDTVSEKDIEQEVHLCVSLSAAGVVRVEVLGQPAAVPDWVQTQLGPAGPHPSRTQTLPPRLPADDAR